MRLHIIAITIPLTTACSEGSGGGLPLCTEADTVSMAPDDRTPFGDSPNSVIASFTSLAQTTEITTPNGATFLDVFHWTVALAGQSQSTTMSKTALSAGVDANCPIGRIMKIPISVSISTDEGLHTTDTGNIWVHTETGDRWFGLTTTGEPAAPDYLPSVHTCSDEPGILQEIHMGISHVGSLANGPGFHNVTGGITTVVYSETFRCGNGVATWRHLQFD